MTRHPEVGELFTVNHAPVGRWRVLKTPDPEGKTPGTAICVRDRDGVPCRSGISPADYWPEDANDYEFTYDEAATIEFYIIGKLL